MQKRKKFGKFTQFYDFKYLIYFVKRDTNKYLNRRRAELSKGCNFFFYLDTNKEESQLLMQNSCLDLFEYLFKFLFTCI